MNINKIDSNKFKQAMGQFPSGVTLVTTLDDEDQRCGFTASAFSSLSHSPPLILVCLANSTDCFDTFINGKQFAVNIIGQEHEKLAFKFATKDYDKFEGNEFEAGESGLPILTDSPVSLECKTKYTYPGGDHVILVGQVEHLRLNGGRLTVWHEGKFHHISA